MDPETVTAGVAAAQLFAQVALNQMMERAVDKAVEKSADEVVEGAATGVGKLVDWVRARFAGSNELVRVDEAADSPARVAALADVINRRIADDPEAASELATLLRDVRQSEAGVWQQAIGSNNIQVGNNSSVSITGPTVTGHTWNR